MKKNGLLFLFYIFFSNNLPAQERITTAGIQFKPVFPSNFFGTGPRNFEMPPVRFTIQQKTGFCAGMVVRKGLTKNFSFETGINLVHRSYHLEAEDSGFHAKLRFRSISYEIPTLVLLFVQLSRKIYMDVAFGHCLDVFPSDLYAETEGMKQYGARKYWIGSSLLANLGYEYRTEKSGYFYLGASFHRPFSFIYMSEIEYTGNNRMVQAKEKLSGNYLTVDLRYFFHADPEKRKKKIKKKQL